MAVVRKTESWLWFVPASSVLLGLVYLVRHEEFLGLCWVGIGTVATLRDYLHARRPKLAAAITGAGAAVALVIALTLMRHALETL
ncbi:hypothetical protein ASE01_04940 [Nocardioides sp. Root190]|uniref:hypothetical protein n=1 Tax=Nocardioides sp. Root190 TaxID=1736488 RepID=UPI0006F6AC12|nr:hypothetical protein [Nocardioides sp. Root190]KRB78600.1 hypothetical protein ASE01_04940 [Nocardioides sp. Root190]